MAESLPRRNMHAADQVIREPERTVPVIGEYDVCVVGGSCTGVFAAVAAARLGAKVCLIENAGFFGGTATASLVNVWHSLLGTEHKRKIIGGLTEEVIERLAERQAVVRHGESNSKAFEFNSAEMILELDALVAEAGVTPMLHTRFVAPALAGKRLDAVIVEDKTGRRAVRARQFIDATGDADLVARAGLPTYKDSLLQPPTTCVHLLGLDDLARQT